MSILDKARAGQNFLEQIANAVPGFKGYREQELRRDADRIEREHLASQLEECKKALNALASDATRGGSLDVINDVEKARKRLDKLIARIRYAERGYSGFFDAIKIDESVLERVYQFDASLLAEAEAIRGAAEKAGAGRDVSLAAFLAATDALDARLAERDQILSGVR